jgi:hypothetical protein
VAGVSVIWDFVIGILFRIPDFEIRILPRGARHGAEPDAANAVRGRAKFLLDFAAKNIECFGRDAEFLGDFFLGDAQGDAFRRLAFARRQPFDQGLRNGRIHLKGVVERRFFGGAFCHGSRPFLQKNLGVSATQPMPRGPNADLAARMLIAREQVKLGVVIFRMINVASKIAFQISNYLPKNPRHEIRIPIHIPMTD